MIPFTDQKHTHPDTNNVDGETKKDLIHQRSMGVFVHVITEKT